jgi:hypothetical protein
VEFAKAVSAVAHISFPLPFDSSIINVTLVNRGVEVVVSML